MSRRENREPGGNPDGTAAVSAAAPPIGESQHRGNREGREADGEIPPRRKSEDLLASRALPAGNRDEGAFVAEKRPRQRCCRGFYFFI